MDEAEHWLLTELHKRFPANRVKIRDGNHYITIEDTISRLNKVCGISWDWTLSNATVAVGPESSRGKAQYLAHAYGDLAIETRVSYTESDGDYSYRIIRSGSGAALNVDYDGAIKTAQAEALKKATNQYGVAAYLWNADERKIVNAVQAEDIPTIKAFFSERAFQQGVERTADALCGFYDVAGPEDFNDLAFLERKLEDGSVPFAG